MKTEVTGNAMLKRVKTTRPKAWQIGGVCGLLLFAGSLWFLLVRLPESDIPENLTEPDRQELIIANRANVLKGLQTAIGLGFLGVAYLVWRDRHRSQAKQMSDRFVKAVEMLFSKRLGVRLGAIYALEKIAQESSADHPQVMEVLTAFIREKTTQSASPVVEKPDADVQVALTVIGRRWAENDDEPLDLRQCQLQGASLTGANLPGVLLNGANLQQSQLQGANLQEAQLQGAVLRRAALTQANLKAANLAQANLQWAQLGNANLTGAQLNGAILQQAQLQEAILQKSQLENSNLQGACLTLAKLQGADLNNTNLHQAEMRGAQLQGARLNRANLQQVRLDEANLQETSLENANLRWASLRGADLQKANCFHASFQGACLEGALLDKTILEEANFKD